MASARKKWRDLFLQGARAGARKAAPTRRPRLQRAVWGLAIAGLVVTGGVAFAQTTTCTQTLPLPLVTFCANAPALASEVNGNFSTAHSWINQKVGAPGSAAVAMTSTLNVAGATSLASTLNVTGATALNNLAVSGSESFGNATRQMINLFATDYGLGVQASTTYFRSGSAFAWFRGGTHSDTQFNSGGGANAMTLDSNSNLAVSGELSAATAVKSRGVAVVRDVTTCCSGSSGNCCPGGYTVVGADLNTGAGGQFCYLCYLKAN